MSELTALAATAASTIVAAMATDLWGQVKQRISRLFGRNDEKLAGESQQQLEDSRRRVTEAAEGDRAEVQRDEESQWRGAFWHLLSTEPALADEVRAILAEAAAAVPPRPEGSSAQQVVVVRDHGTANVAGHDQINVNLGHSRRDPR